MSERRKTLRSVSADATTWLTLDMHFQFARLGTSSFGDSGLCSCKRAMPLFNSAELGWHTT